LQLNAHAVPLHEAVEFAGVVHGAHAVPQLLVLVFVWQIPLQSCVPAGHIPMQVWSCAMHAPAQSFWLAGQVPPHDVPSHVAVPPPVGAVQAVHEVPQLVGLVFDTQVVPHRW
jgi:hypothetical protein